MEPRQPHLAVVVWQRPERAGPAGGRRAGLPGIGGAQRRALGGPVRQCGRHARLLPVAFAHAAAGRLRRRAARLCRGGRQRLRRPASAERSRRAGQLGARLQQHVALWLVSGGGLPRLAAAVQPGWLCIAGSRGAADDDVGWGSTDGALGHAPRRLHRGRQRLRGSLTRLHRSGCGDGRRGGAAGGERLGACDAAWRCRGGRHAGVGVHGQRLWREHVLHGRGVHSELRLRRGRLPPAQDERQRRGLGLRWLRASAADIADGAQRHAHLRRGCGRGHPRLGGRARARRQRRWRRHLDRRHEHARVDGRRLRLGRGRPLPQRARAARRAGPLLRHGPQRARRHQHQPHSLRRLHGDAAHLLPNLPAGGAQLAVPHLALCHERHPARALGGDRGRVDGHRRARRGPDVISSVFLQRQSSQRAARRRGRRVASRLQPRLLGDVLVRPVRQRAHHPRILRGAGRRECHAGHDLCHRRALQLAHFARRPDRPRRPRRRARHIRHARRRLLLQHAALSDRLAEPL